MTSAVLLLFSISMPHGTVKFWQKQYVIWVFSLFYEYFGFQLNSNLMHCVFCILFSRETGIFRPRILFETTTNEMWKTP